jgi:hypothetical protein
LEYDPAFEGKVLLSRISPPIFVNSRKLPREREESTLANDTMRGLVN